MRHTIRNRRIRFMDFGVRFVIGFIEDKFTKNT